MRRKKGRAKEPRHLHDHFRRRWSERVGGTAPIKEIESAIHRQDHVTARPVFRQSHNRRHYIYSHNGEEWCVVYDKLRRSVVTVLPQHVVASYV